MELAIIARFHAKEGAAAAIEAAMRDMPPPVRAESGCIAIELYRAPKDPRLFFIHSRWRDEAAFELHATHSHTTRFIERVQPLIDHPLDINRLRALT